MVSPKLKVRGKLGKLAITDQDLIWGWCCGWTLRLVAIEDVCQSFICIYNLVIACLYIQSLTVH